ncbi:MAG TPA: uL15 family ribosomal protein [Candidatus Paceibacterota bacterium]|jgi:large subunit ribosomal protein L15|nr:uL15 family ribosomal protein [Candidatus Paceibacterota bacterium]
MALSLSNLEPVHKLKNKKRVGRGGKRGTYSGRGQKGQKARAGHKIKEQERENLLKIPQRLGIKFQARPKPLVKIITLTDLDKNFSKGEVVNNKTLVKRGLIKKTNGKMPKVKILANGSITKPLIISQIEISKSAKELIEKAKGKVE